MSTMKEELKCISFCLLVCYFFNLSEGSVISLAQSPSVITEHLTPSLNLRCGLNDTDGTFSSQLIGRRDVTNSVNNIDHVTSIVVSRGNGYPVASMSVHLPARPLTDLMSLAVTGDVNAGTTGERGYLDLTWTRPTLYQSGDYQCQIVGLDDNGHTIIFTKTMHVNVTTPSRSQLANYIADIQIDNSKIHAEIANITTSSHATPNTTSSSLPACIQVPVCPTSAPATTASSTASPTTTTTTAAATTTTLDPYDSNECCNNATQDINALNEQVSLLSSGFTALESGVAKTEADMKDLKTHSKSVDSRFDGLDIAFENVTNALNNANLANGGLKKDIDTLKVTFTNFTTANVGVIDSIMNQTRVCSEHLQQEYNSLNTTVKELASVVDILIAKAGYADTSLDKLTAQIQSIDAVSMKTDINNLTLMFEEFTSDTNIMKEKINDVENATDHIMVLVNKVTGSASTLGLDVDHLKVEDKFFKDELALLQNGSSTIQSQFVSVLQDNQDLKTEVAELQKDKEIMESVLLNLTVAVDAIPSHQTNTNTDQGQINTTCACDAVVSELKAEIGGLENKVNFLEVDVENIKTENTNLRQLTNKLDSNVGALTSKNDIVSADNTLLKAQTTSLVSEIAQLNEKINYVLGKVSTKHIEEGEMSCGDSWNWTGKNGHLRYTTKTVHFSTAFDSAPHVHIGVTKFNQESLPNPDPFFEVQIAGVTSNSLTVKCVIYQGVRVFDLKFSWISFSKT